MDRRLSTKFAQRHRRRFRRMAFRRISSKRRNGAKWRARNFRKNSISGLAMEWSSALAVEGRQSPEDDIRAIQKVTVDDVNRVARQYLGPISSIVAVLTPQPSGAPVSSKSFGGTEALAGNPNGAVHAAGMGAERRHAHGDSRSDDPSGGQHAAERNQADRAAGDDQQFRHGRRRNQEQCRISRRPPDRTASPTCLESYFPMARRRSIASRFKRRWTISQQTNLRGTSFSLSVLAADFDRGVQLLADNELHPALPEQAFQVVQQQTADTVAGQLQSPDYLTQRAFETAPLPQDRSGAAASHAGRQ